MTESGLLPNELALMRQVFRRHPVTQVKLIGSRALATHRPNSDIELVVWGDVDLRGAGRLAEELDGLPLPYSFDVQHFGSIKRAALREQIERAGVEIFANPGSSTGR